MFKNHLKIAWRALLKSKGYATINILGLAIGLACCLLIGLYIQDELSYDQYHVKKNRIYRVLHGFSESGTAGSVERPQERSFTYQVWGNAPVGKALKADFPEVQEVCQFSGQSSVLLRYNEKAFQEENVFYADSNVLNVFSWKLLAGDPKTALVAPYSTLLTASTAKKYFGDENPIGKTLEGAGGRANPGTYTVTGILEDIPSNSHFSFDALMSMSSFRQSWSMPFEEWGYVDFYTYFVVPENFDIKHLSAKIPSFLNRHHANDDGRYNIAFEPLLGAYLHSTAERQPGVTGSLTNLYIFGVIGAFILFIACINFMNLATARSMERAKEVGVRKVVGADRGILIRQFMIESLLMILIAASLAFLVIWILLPLTNSFTGKHFEFTRLFNWRTLSVYLPVVLLTGLIAGSYPALVLSGFRPITILRGAFRNSAKGIALRKGLVVFQFSLSIALIAGTVIVISQLNHLQHKDLGFKQEKMLVIDFNNDDQVTVKLDAIKQTFLQEQEVLSVSASRSVPGSYFPNAGTQIEGPSGNLLMESPALFEVDVDFIPHFGIEMAAGRSYSRDFPADTSKSLVINEAAAKLYGYSNPQDIIGKHFSQWGKEGTIIGVTKDFNYLSLHKHVEPLALRFEPQSSRFITLRIQSDKLPATIAKLGEIWAKLAPHRPYLYSFLDDSFNRQYEADQRFRNLFSVFASLAILIACLGLLGLATYTAQQRTKEIGVRKVLGASVGNIVQLLSIDFVKLVLVAGIIASPVAWWVMNQWLDNFAYRMEIHWWIFAGSALIGIIIALLTVGFQAIKAALANPVDSLRNE